MRFTQIKPQKARGVLRESMWSDPQWIAEEKFDGDRRIAQFLGSRVRFTGTRESVDGSGFVEKTDNLPHLNTSKPFFEGHVLDGEIVAPFADKLPGGKSKYVTAIMGSLPARAIELQKKHGWLEYRVFDCLWYKGIDLRNTSLVRRRKLAKTALDEWGCRYAKLVIPQLQNKREFYEEVVRTGGEGVVLKHLEHTYGDEKLWVKVKGEWTADVVLTGFTPGKGKYVGSVGAIIFAQYRGADLEQMGTCSGFDDALRAEFNEGGFKKYKGRVLRIKHNGREPTGAFRHPRFDSWRDDKTPESCVYDPNES